MLPAHIEKELAEVELCFNDVSAALVSGEPMALAAASVSLRQAALDFSGVLQHVASAELKDNTLTLRLKKIADGMALQRQSLIRRTVLVEMALNTVVPATGDAATYAKTTGPYGSAGKQTGAFKYLAA
ncbi:MAG: hypothetical protein V4713_02435 [Pseudomonadota bacterium]